MRFVDTHEQVIAKGKIGGKARAMVVTAGTVNEASINGFPSSAIEKKLKADPYRFLIVADKFQTGYDEPLLHTMYKVLNAVIYSIMSDNMELFKQFNDNQSFKKWLSDMVFNVTYNTEVKALEARI